jgi:hypothetical protein
VTGLVIMLALGDVFVDPARGDDANDGKAATSAFRTLKRAVEALRPGDVLRLAKTAEPYREALILEKAGVTVEGGGATISGLDPVDPALFKERSPGLIVARLQPPRPQAQVHIDGDPLEYESKLEDIEPGQQVWQRNEVHVALPEGKRWPGPAVGLLARTEGVVIRAPRVVVRGLTVERIGGPGIVVSGAATGVRLEDVEVRLCRWGDSAGLRVTDTAEVAVVGGRLLRNAAGAVAIHRAKLTLAGCVVEGNRHFGVRLSGPEHAVENGRFKDNGAFDVAVRALDPESANGGGPVLARLVRCLFGTGVSVEGGEPPAKLEVEGCVFLKSALSRSGATLLARRNLYADAKFSVDGEAADVAAWRAATGDEGSRWVDGVPAGGGWEVEGRPVGPSR